MGMGFCRFPECADLPFGDRPGTNIDYHVYMPDQQLELLICGLWEHYATEHNVLPPAQARVAVMAADSTKATGKVQRWRGQGPEVMSIYFVERVGDGYDHQIGELPDTEFIEKLDELIDAAKLSNGYHASYAKSCLSNTLRGER